MRISGIAQSAGMQAQVRALAEALGADLQMLDVQVKPAFAWLPNGLFAAGLKHFVVPGMLQGNLPEDVPNVVISCGRRAAITAMGLQCKTRYAATKFIHIQDPLVNARQFDLVIAMEHDKITGPNVLKLPYALHNITPEKLEAARSQFESQFAPYPEPRIAVMLGGSTNKYVFTLDAMQQIIANLQAMLATMKGSLLITTSRRSGAENTELLKHIFADNKRVFIYDGQGDNPYMGMLALTDKLVVTNDSVNMMTEAAATRKPVYLMPLPDHADTKPAHFAEKLVHSGVARVWQGEWDSWKSNFDGGMDALAEEVRRRL